MPLPRQAGGELLHGKPAGKGEASKRPRRIAAVPEGAVAVEFRGVVAESHGCRPQANTPRRAKSHRIDPQGDSWSSNEITHSIAILLAAPAAVAQSGDDWNFLSDASIFRDVHGVLPAYLKNKAGALLDERERAIARIATMADLTARQQYFRDRMWSYLGARPERTPLNARVVGTLDRGDFRIEKIIFESRPGFYVTANLYLPVKGKAPYPAILFPLGHEGGAKAHQAWQRCLAGLARRGFVALAWDPIGQGERVQMYDEDWHDSKMQSSTVEHTIIGMQCLLTGTHIAQYTIWDGIRALDYLLSRPEVDARRVGCTGNSGGGTHTAYLSGLDDRIQAAAPSCYITSWRRMLESIGPQDAEQVFPLWLKDGLDYPDYLYAFGGKPFLMLTAIRDFFPIGGARATFDEAQRVYGKLGLADHIAKFEFDDGHGYSQPRREAGYRWFTRWLQGAENTEPEAPLSLATEEELQCTRTGQVQTEFPGAADVFSLNRKLAGQLRAGRKPTPESVRKFARELSFYKAATAPLRITPFGETARPACRLEKLTYESEPGIAIPALLFVPNGGPARKPAIIFADGKGKSSAAAEAEQLAARGYITLVPDLRGFGETQPALDRRDSFVRNFGDYGEHAHRAADRQDHGGHARGRPGARRRSAGRAAGCRPVPDRGRGTHRRCHSSALRRALRQSHQEPGGRWNAAVL